MIIQKLSRKIVYHLYILIPFRPLKPSSEPIDVVIPILQKDLKILPLCLEGVRRCVVNQVKDIYIVSPRDERIIEFCKDRELVYVDEASLFDFSPKDMKLMVGNDKRDRSGWLFQQFIKLSGKIGTCENYLCIDADHILIRPHVFLTTKGLPVFYKSSEYHKPYTDSVEKLTGQKHFAFLSYVAHKMCFNKTKLKELHRVLEEKEEGKTWTQVIIDSYDRREGSGISEFQLYGHYVDRKIERPWLEHDLLYDKLEDYAELCKQYSHRYASVTFPEWMNKIE
ncbi:MULTISPECIES: DUF6492 family protein [Phocaeicola]|uniref:DUF6492 family protein n=1 Tax=Phocaeicola TaxID=909656 RepID=UPI000E469E7D|nr:MULTISPECIES: DUF6492 family protein [Phocaeicola]